MSRTHRLCVVIALLTTTSGCTSLVLTKGPEPPGHPNHEASVAFCSTGKGLIVLDGVIGGFFAFSGLVGAGLASTDEGEARSLLFAGGITGLSVVSMVAGNRRVNECRAAKLEALERARERMEARTAMERLPGKR